MLETELRKHRCCFTGHRPEKLTIPEKRLAGLLEAEIIRAIDSGHTTFITGMAKGVDIVAAEIVLRLKLICALPYPGFGQHWGGGWTERSRQVLVQADLERTICPGFSYGAYQARFVLGKVLAKLVCFRLKIFQKCEVYFLRTIHQTVLIR